jgi:hypothetical protein
MRLNQGALGVRKCLEDLAPARKLFDLGLQVKWPECRVPTARCEARR